MTSIRQTSKSALADMRATLHTLRGGEADVADEQTKFAGVPGGRPPGPTLPGLDRLDTLVDAVRAAGAPVTVSVTGERRPVPESVDHAAYRILQESLTNVLRHAGQDARATVALFYATDALTITVADDGIGAGGRAARSNGDSNGMSADGSGHGLIGMRERAAAVGGEVTAGPREAGGFEVTARLPLAEVGVER